MKRSQGNLFGVSSFAAFLAAKINSAGIHLAMQSDFPSNELKDFRRVSSRQSINDERNKKL